MFDRLCDPSRRIAPDPRAAGTRPTPGLTGPESRRGRADGLRSRVPRNLLQGGALLLALALAGCSVSAPKRSGAAAYEPPTSVSARVTLAPPVLSAEVEADYLSRANTTAELLRRAYLELLLRRPDAALDSAAEVLYGATPASANDESFARFLRAEAYRQQGHPERGRFDLERARVLAMDPDLQRRLAPAAAAPSTPASTPLGPLAIEERAAWHPHRPNARNLDPMQKPSRVTIHHSAMYFRDTRPSACAAQIARIQHEHMQNRQYGDIGYHFLIDPSGRIWEGRELRWQGAHASGDNNVGNIGICLLGNFVQQREGQGPTAAQVRSMEQLVVGLMQHYGFGPDALYCHSDFKATECPGPLMTPIVKQLARQLRANASYVARQED